jgi:hypothetical protein
LSLESLLRVLVKHRNLSAEDAEDAEYFRVSNFVCGSHFAVTVLVVGYLGLFSAKDAKDAKYFWDSDFDAGNRYAITV